MNVFVSGDGDAIGQLIGRMSLADDVAGIRKISQKIEMGNEIFASWAVNSAGNVISDGGDEFRIEIPAEKLPELESLRERYEKLTTHTISVGVGMKLSEADKALLVAKLRGKDRIVLWDPAFGKELEDAQNDGSDEAKKLTEHYLDKAEGVFGRKAAVIGQKEAVGSESKIGATSGKLKTLGAKERLAERLARLATAPRAATSMGSEPGEIVSDKEEENRQSVSENDYPGKERKEAESQEQEKLKQAVAEALLKIKRAAPILDRMRQANPDLYNAVKGTIDAMLLMAKKVVQDGPPDNVQKSELEESDLEKACRCDAYSFPHRSSGGKCKCTQIKGQCDCKPVEKDELEKGDIVKFPIDKVTPAKKKRSNAEIIPLADDVRYKEQEKPKVDKPVVAASGIKGINQYDYSHFLDEKDRAKGLSLIITGDRGRSDGYTIATLMRGNTKLGNLWSYPAMAQPLVGRDPLSDFYSFKPQVQRAIAHHITNFVKEELQATEPKPEQSVDEDSKELDKQARKTNKMVVKYPVGTLRGGPAPGNGNREAGKIKVERDPYDGGEGKPKFIEARAGAIMSQTGGPISSRNPNGK